MTIDLRVENHLPSTTAYDTCTKYTDNLDVGVVPYLSTCPSTTNFYVNETYVWIEDGATDLVITSDGGTVSRSINDRQPGYVDWTLGFAKIFNGQSRKLHVTYSIAGGAPPQAGEGADCAWGGVFGHISATVSDRSPT